MHIDTEQETMHVDQEPETDQVPPNTQVTSDTIPSPNPETLETVSETHQENPNSETQQENLNTETIIEPQPSFPLHPIAMKPFSLTKSPQIPNL
jgi:hypothetical protein